MWRPEKRQRVFLIDKLEFLIAVAREKSFRRAAEACGVAQPTLSAGVKQLEETLGVMLVHRNSRFQGLTAEGERVLEWAKKLAGDARAMREEVRAFKKRLSGHLRIAVIPSALPFIPRLTNIYQSLHPDVRLTILSRSSSEIIDLINDLEIEAGVTYIGVETIGKLESVPLYIERYRLLITSSSPLSKRLRVTWTEIKDLPLCLLTPDMQNRRILEKLLWPAEEGDTLRILEADSMITLIAHVLHGGKVTIVSEQIADLLAASDAFRAIPIIDPDAEFRIGLVVSSRHLISPLINTLVSATRQISTTTKKLR